MVNEKVLDYWHLKTIEDMEEKSSLKFLRGRFLPLGSGPHPLWLSLNGSASAIQAAVLQTKILIGCYRDDYYSSKWNNKTGHCSLLDCDHFPGDVRHYLSGTCPSLSEPLKITLNNVLKISSQHLTSSPQWFQQERDLPKAGHSLSSIPPQTHWSSPSDKIWGQNPSGPYSDSVEPSFGVCTNTELEFKIVIFNLCKLYYPPTLYQVSIALCRLKSGEFLK